VLVKFVRVGEFLLLVVIEERGCIAKIFRWLLFCLYWCKYFENFPGTAVCTSWLFTFGAVNIKQLKRGYDKNKIRDMDGKEQLRNLQGRDFCWQIFLQDPPPCPVCHWTLNWNNLFVFVFFFPPFFLMLPIVIYWSSLFPQSLKSYRQNVKESDSEGVNYTTGCRMLEMVLIINNKKHEWRKWTPKSFSEETGDWRTWHEVPRGLQSPNIIGVNDEDVDWLGM